MTPPSMGLIVNPLAGLGGRVGLKGSDGDRAGRAIALGARPEAGRRAVTALTALRSADVQLLTCSGAMGEEAARRAGVDARVVYSPADPLLTSGADTGAAAVALRDLGVDLLLFVGGDGTARDVLGAVGHRVPVLGVPAGVKMHSAVFAASPRAAGDVARRFLAATDRAGLLREAEVMDREEGLDERAPSPILYGTLRVPQVSFLVPGPKSAGSADIDEGVTSAIARVARELSTADIALIGPGSTMQRLKAALGAPGALLGVAIFSKGECLVPDATEAQILECLPGRSARIVLSVVGGQGFLFGRGNQPLSARVIRAVGRQNITVISSMAKLAQLPLGAVLVDTGDETLDAELAGYVPVLVEEGRSVIVAIRPFGEADTAAGGTP